MATTLIVLMILGLGAAALLGRTPDSRDQEYGLAALVGRTPIAAEPALDESAAAAVLTVPAAWLTLPQVARR